MKTKEKTVNEIRNEYYRSWRSRNRERVKEINSRYWKKYAEKKRQEKLAENQV